MANSLEGSGGSERLRDLVGIIIIFLAGGLVYATSLHVPWYFDDIPAIVENPVIRDLGQAWQGVFASRGVANLSFAVNYWLGGMAVEGFHLSNLLIHLITAGIVYCLAKRVFPGAFWQQLAVALIFVAHPLQTQAVTYVVQRMASLAGLFFFLAIYLYLRFLEGLNADDRAFPFRNRAFYLLALLAGAAAVMTKQNTAVLPVALLLFERYFLPGRDWRRQLVSVLPFCLVPAWSAIQGLVLPVLTGGAALATVGHAASLSTQSNLTPLNYLVTEFSVLWLYLRLLFIPVGQALEYAYPVVERVLQLQNILAFLGLSGLVGLGLWLRPKRKVLSFGIFWFFLSLLVESSIIPLDPVFEHRLYLAMFGFALVLVDLSRLFPRQNLAICGLALVVTTFGILTWQRNTLWNDPVAFYQDNLKRYPGGERTMNSLAISYAARGDSASAESLYRQALQLNPKHGETYRNFGKLLVDQKSWEEASTVLGQGLSMYPQNATLINTLGIVYSQRGEKHRAVESFQKAIDLAPTMAEAYFNLGIIYMERGQPEVTEELNRRVLSMFPENGQAHYNLGVVYFYRQDFRAARDAFEQAHRNHYNETNSLYNLALAELKLGNRSAVAAILPRLKALNASLGAQMQAKLAEGGRASE